MIVPSRLKIEDDTTLDTVTKITHHFETPKEYPSPNGCEIPSERMHPYFREGCRTQQAPRPRWGNTSMEQLQRHTH